MQKRCVSWASWRSLCVSRLRSALGACWKTTVRAGQGASCAERHRPGPDCRTRVAADYGYESSYDGEEEEDAGRSAAGLAARSRMLATLALDRRERLQDQTLDAMQPPPAAATEQLEPEVAEGSPSPDRQRALAMAALKAAREDASLRLSTQWSSDVEGAYRARSRRPETVVREVYVPPPRPRAVDAPLGTMGALGLLQDEWSGDGEALTQQSAPERERDEEHGARVAADVDAILSSALSELGMEVSGGGEEARDTVVRVSGEQVRCSVAQCGRCADVARSATPLADGGARGTMAQQRRAVTRPSSSLCD